MNRPVESDEDHHRYSVVIVASTPTTASTVKCSEPRGAMIPARKHAIATVTNHMTCTVSLGLPLLQEIHASQATPGPRPTRQHAVAVRAGDSPPRRLAPSGARGEVPSPASPPNMPERPTAATACQPACREAPTATVAW